MTSQDRIEIQARLTIPLFAEQAQIPPMVPVNSMSSILVMLVSWQTYFMTSILVTHSQCVNVCFSVLGVGLGQVERLWLLHVLGLV